MNEDIKHVVDRPWHLLPEGIKQWVRDNGYLIRESGGGATCYAKWKDEYIRLFPNGNTHDLVE